MLSSVSVRGEISNLKYHGSGHIYFSLKDEKALISCVMFASNARSLKWKMEEGARAVISGSVEVYERDGRYQLYAKEAIPEGRGDLDAEFRKLKEKLEEMGLFAQEYKQPIPAYIKTLGIVTAPTGAAVRDIINIARRRNPFVQLILYPAAVQGEHAAESIVRGIRALERYGVDVMIVGRGGGSMEDLWAFNEEVVAQAIFDCSVPVISAVGHETDTTIADYVADLRAPTPSAAAELAVFEIRPVLERLAEYERRLGYDMQGQVERKRAMAERLKNRLERLSPEAGINSLRQRAAALEERLSNAMESILMKRRHYLEILGERLKARYPYERLGGGYAYVSDKEGRGVDSAGTLSEGQELKLFFKDGSAEVRVKEIVLRQPAEAGA